MTCWTQSCSAGVLAQNILTEGRKKSAPWEKFAEHDRMGNRFLPFESCPSWTL